MLEYRLKNEYNVELYMEGLPYEYLRWIRSADGEPVKEEDLILGTDVKRVEDYKGNQLLLFGSQWALSLIHISTSVREEMALTGVVARA